MERAEGHQPVRDRRDHLRVVLADDTETPVNGDRWSVDGRKVTVAGAARSGIAAAELLAGRGAKVTLSDTRAQVSEAEPLRKLGVELELGGHRTETFSDAD